MALVGVRRALLKRKKGTTTFDPSNSTANQVLSNGNLTVTGTGTGIARSIASHTSGKFYAEITLGGSIANLGVGVVDSSESLSAGQFVGTDSHGCGSGYGSGGWIGGAVGGTTTAPTQVSGHVYGLAVDITNRKIWIKDLTAAGNWNANGTADPATGVNGAIYDVGMSGLSIYAAMTAAGAGDNATWNFGATPYAGVPPAGFGNW